MDAVVSAHHGTAAVDSVPGRTAFTIRLPHATVVTADPDPELDADESLVEDPPVIIRPRREA